MVKNENFDEIDYLEESSEENQTSESSPGDFKKVVTWSTDWTVGTIYDLIRKNRIDLNPDLQRRDVWSNKKKSNLIESIMLNIPIPQIILAEDKNKPGSYIVIDGKQRLLTISQFMESGKNSLKIGKVEVLTEIIGKTKTEIEKTPQNKHLLDIFETQTLRTIILRNWDKEELLYTIFNRINTGTEKLSPQELRMSLYPGEFMKFVNNNSYFNEVGELLKIDEPDKRMRDVELIIRYYAFHYYFQIYNGRLRSFFDYTADNLNKKAKQLDGMEEISKDFDHFKNTLRSVKGIFGENSFRIYSSEEKVYSKDFNKTAFDLLMFFASKTEVYPLLGEGDGQGIFKRCYERLFEDREIVEGFKAHTTDLSKVKYRFNKFAKLLSDEFGIKLGLIYE